MTQNTYFGYLEPGAHIGVSGSRFAPADDARNSLRFCIEQLAALGAHYLHQGCCTGWDELAVTLARKAGMRVVGHPPVKTAYLSEQAVKESDVLWPSKSYRARNMDIAWETAVLVTGPQYPEDHSESARSGTWMTTRFARLYNSRVYACWNDGNIEDVTKRTEIR